MLRDVLLAILVSVAAQTPAETQAVSPTVAEQPGDRDEDIVVTGDKPNPDKKVCKRSVATGSIMPKVTCRTVSEWEEQTERSVALMERFKADQQSRQHVKESRENR